MYLYKLKPDSKGYQYVIIFFTKLHRNVGKWNVRDVVGHACNAWQMARQTPIFLFLELVLRQTSTGQ